MKELSIQFTKDFVFYTIQGEGKYVGSPSVFIRLSGCNLRCEWKKQDGKTNLCDTSYSSHYPENIQKSLDDVIDEVNKYDCKHVVITGGEPFLQPELADLVESLKASGHYITIETNGTIYFPTQAEFISLSPKLKSSCQPASKNYESHNKTRINIEALAAFIMNHEVQLKFVVNEESDIREIKELTQDLEIRTQKSLQDRIYLMPQALTPDDLQKNSAQVIEWSKDQGWNFADRLHIRIWGPKRGV